MKETDELKQELLIKYARKDPHPFIQVDIHCRVEPGDGDPIVIPDKEGQAVIYTYTDELMNGPRLGVRMLINPETTKEEALMALAKVAGFIAKYGIPKHDYLGSNKLLTLVNTGQEEESP